jgi:hypothetical protein
MALPVRVVAGGNGAGVEADGTTAFSLLSAGTTNATLIKRGAGRVVSIHAVNTNASLRYLKMYDTDRIPVAGSGIPTRRYAIPASTTGLGFVLTPGVPMAFLSGIGFTITGGVADSDTTVLTANDVILTIEYT